MPAQDIVDNRTEKLEDHINRILPSTEWAKFAGGYFFLSGLEPNERTWKTSGNSGCSSVTALIRKL